MKANKREQVKLPFAQINAAALGRLPDFVEQWLPDGKWRGREYQALNPRCSDTTVGSFSVNTVTGRWADFATEDAAGGDVVSLYAYIFGLRQGEAARELAQKVGVMIEERPKPALKVVNGRLPSRFRATPAVPSEQAALPGRFRGDHPKQAQSGEIPHSDEGMLQAVRETPRALPAEEVEEPTGRSVRKKVADMWRATEDAGHPLLGQYWENRGIGGVNPGKLQDVRLHLELDYWNPNADGGVDCLGQFPTMLALVRDVMGRGVGLHRTYLSHDGAAKLALPDQNNPWDEIPLPAKKLLAFESGSTRGGAIRLVRSDNGSLPQTLHVAEGIETALAVSTRMVGDVWATVSANGMAALVVPESFSRVMIWADKDVSKAGQEAADALADRLREIGLHTEIRTPPMAIPDGKKSIDWLDVSNLPQEIADKAFTQRGWIV